MPLDSSVFGSGDLDQITNDIYSHYQPDDGQPFSSDTGDLSLRLARKLSGDQFKGVDFDKVAEKPKKETTDAPDLSSFGEEAPQPSSEDLSNFGEPPPAPTPAPLGVSGNLAAAGKGLVRGAPMAAASMAQGAAIPAGPLTPEKGEVGPLVDELSAVPGMTPGERAKLVGRALRTIGDRGLQMDFNGAVQRIARGGDPGSEISTIKGKLGTINADQDQPIEDQAKYKTAKALKDWVDKAVPMTDQEKSSIGGQVGTGISSMAPYLAAGVIAGPEAGMILGAAGMGAQTAGDTFQAAKAKGATDDQAATAAGWSGAIGAALGTLPLGSVFSPVTQAAPGMKAWLAAKLVHAARSGTVFATVGEAQEFLLQQVAKEQYDSQAGYSPEAKRVIAGLITGGMLGAAHPLHQEPGYAPPHLHQFVNDWESSDGGKTWKNKNDGSTWSVSDDGKWRSDRGKTGEGPFSTPEDIAEFLRQANAGGRSPDDAAAAARGAQTRSEIDDFIRQKDAAEAANAPRLPPPDENSPQASTPSEPEPKPSPTGGEAETPSAATEQTEIDGLKRHGWSDDEIQAMSPSTRREFFQEAMKGEQPGNNPVKTPTEAPTSPSKGEGAPETTPVSEESNPVPGTRGSPMRPETGADVFHAQAAEPTDAQAKAENYQHSHMELPHLGLTGRNSISIETGAGQTRRSVDADGTVHENMLPFPYGRIKGTKGADGEPLDITVGPNPKSPHVFVIDQHHNDGSGFDEHKIMAGFDTPQEALIAYGAAYDDLGGNRIGHVTALTPEQFSEWRKGDTTQPLKKTLSEKEIGDIFDDLVGAEKGGEPENTSKEPPRSPQLPQEMSDGGPSPSSAGAVKSSEASSSPEPHQGEVIPSGKVSAEPTQEHHVQIEAVLGKDYHHVLPVDVQRAAEILSEKPGITPQIAFQYAVIENAAQQRMLTQEKLEQLYGPQVKKLLESSGQKPHSGSEPVEQSGTTPDQKPTSGGEQGGELPGSGAAGERGGSPAAENGEQHDAGGKKPNAKRQARNRADQGATAGKEGAEGADESEHPGLVIKSLQTGKETVLQPKGTVPPKKERVTSQWREIGTNASGNPIYEDQRGVRSYTEKGIRVTEPVGMRPTKGGGVEISKRERSSEFEPSESATESRSLADAFAAQLKGDGFPNILTARRIGKEHGVTDLKAIEESLELAAVKAAREIVETSKDPYPELVKLYGKQPKLGMRTSTSVRDQAYSTPVPLAYVADRLAGITHETTVYEPTAGNGALLIAADPKKVLANEINSGRATNLRAQGFKPTGRDASDPGLSIKKDFDRVIANPPFGPVKENGESKVFDMSSIQPGYKTHEIDHAIALRSLDAMKDDGKAVLILGGLNKQLQTEEKRSDGYQAKAKREFYKTLYDNYNVTDHFTVAGELYERQGAGWPVDVVVINGRGKSDRALPAVDVPRIYDSWEALGGLLHGSEDRENDGAAGRPAGGAPEQRPGLAGNGRPDRGGNGVLRPRSGNGQVQPEDVGQNAAGKQPAAAIDAGGSSAEKPRGPVQDRQPVRSGEQPAAERPPSRLSADEIGDIFDELVGGGAANPAVSLDEVRKEAAEYPSANNFAFVANRKYGLSTEKATEIWSDAKGKRPTSEVAASAVKNAASAADEALSGLTALFGGNKLGSMPSFDEETYAKARPMFERAADKFADFKHDIRELMRRMLDHLKDAYKWTTDMLRNARPYVVRFMQDVQDGTVNLHKPEPPKAKRPSTAVETEGQSLYKPKSDTPGLDTLVPTNMKKPIADALTNLERRVGPIDDFVANELGYDKADLEKYFGAEQLDALGLAIDNLNEGKGFIIGDQTGIGKGRVNAAIIKWAMKKGRIPIFTTEKPGLYADIFRDMADIGMEPPRFLATNASLSMPLDESGKNAIKTADTGKHNALMLGLADPDKFRERYDMVLTNYSQMQTVKGESTARRSFLSAIIPSSTILFDESHNAGGAAAGDRKPKNITADRASFARDLVKRANGVFYSSATYAKRPDVMSLYAATDMAMAVEDINSLGEAISKGGIPMQQVVAAQLAKAGQYIRRERSFHGINYNTPSVDVNHDTYDQISHALAAIQEFSQHVKEATKKISKGLKTEAAALGHDNAVSDAGAQSTTFSSKMHNIINQMLLAMKAPEAAKMAIEAIRRGEKPVLTVANTMETFLKDYAADLGVNHGEPMDADFADVLMRYLDRSRRITIKKAFSKEKAEHHVLTDEELGREGLAAYNDTKALIAGMDLSHMPISPIDHIKSELEKAGYSVGEITGRNLMVDYSGKQAVLGTRPSIDVTPKGKNATIKRFNTKPENGGSHALIINQSAASGVSMHAGEKFDDKSKRRMMIVQPEGNIDTHMQLLGRVNRTGQVVLPEYDQLVANIPAEKRPAAVLAKKMASLNANTTASRTSAVTAKDVPDFMNQYGDMIAAGYLHDNPEMNERLAWPVKAGVLMAEDAMRKLTGRIPLLPLKQQEELYAHLEEEYAALIKQMEASGTSPLEAKTLDLKARTLETSEVQGQKNGSGSPFAAPVNVEKASVLRQGKPFKPDELVNRLTERLGIPKQDDPVKWASGFPREIGGREAMAIETIERQNTVKRFDEYVRPILNKIDDVKEQESERNKLNTIKDRWTSIHSLLPIGARVRLNMVDSMPVAVVLDVKQTSETKNPLALGSWKVNFAVADATRQITLPFSRLFLQGQANPESMLDVEVVHTNETPRDTLARFEMMQSGAREDRYIATGNLLAAYDWLNMKGAIINYTDTNGAVHQGILTPKDFKLGEHAIKKGRIVADPVEIKTLLDQYQTLWSKDRQVNISRADRWSDNYQIQAEKKKATGGRYYLDPALTAITGDFYSRGGMMSANVPDKSLEPAIKRLQEIGAQFSAAAAAPKAEKVESPEPPPDDEPPGGGLAARKEATEAPPLKIHEKYGVYLDSGGYVVRDEQTKATVAGPFKSSDAAHEQKRELWKQFQATLSQRAEAASFTTEAQRLSSEIEEKLRAVVHRIAGPSVKVEFHDGLMTVGKGSAGYSSDVGQLAAGTYSLGRDLIKLALQPGNADQMITAAFHEAYHHIEARLATEQERKLMEAETPRLREWIKGKTGLRDDQVDGLAGYEVRAIAFQSYANDRAEGKQKAGEGLHIMVRRWFDRLLEALRQLGNGLRGLGFKTYNDIFNDAYTGKFAEREPSENVNINPDVLTMRADANARVQSSLRDVLTKATLWNKFRERAQDINEGVERLQNAVEARMDGEIPDSKAFYQKKKLFPGKVATEVQDFNKQHLDPLIDLLKANELSLDDVGDIVYAQHAAERNAYIDTINPDARGAGSGMSNEEAQAILDRHNARDLAEIATKVDGIRDFILDQMVRSGLESRATTDAWREQYQHYAPLGGFAEPREDDLNDTFRESGKFNVRGREVKQAFGRGSKADNPLVNLLDQAYRTIERGKKNEYLQSLARALLGLDPEDRKGFVMFDRGKPRRELDPVTGLVRTVDDSSFRFKPESVAYKVNGRTHYMVFDQRPTAEVLKRMHPDALNGVGQAILTMQNKLKAMWTHYSPEFWIRHFLFRYPIEGTINSFEQGNVPRYMADSIPFMGRASKAIFASNRGEVHPDPDVAQYQRYWDEQRKAGGAIAFRQMRDIDMTRDHLDRRLQSLTGRPIATVRDKARAVAEAMDTVTNALDNSLRLAAYAEARRQGKTPEQAAVIARDATVDYQQAGKWKNYVSMIWPFTNVAAQTGARMGSAVSRSRTMRAVFASSVAAGFMSAMFNYLIGGDDKDGIPFFDKMPWWQKQLNLTVMNPFHRDDKGRPIPVHIPLPYNWAFPFTIGQAIATMSYSKTRGEVRRAIAAVTKSGISAFSPFAEDENQAANIAPELLKPLVHAYTNENWTGYPVHLDPAFQKGPRSESGYRTTGEGWKFAARMANAAGGGDKHHSGPLDFFPEDLREVTKYYSGLGTMFDFGLHARNTVENAVAGKPIDYSKLPLARVVMGTDYDAANRSRQHDNERLSKRPWER